MPLQERKKEQERQRQLAQQKRERQKRLAREPMQRESSGSASGSATGRSRGSVIKIFTADANYQKGDQISASGNVITCKWKDCFVIEGATLSEIDQGIEANPIGNIIRIRVPNVGTFKVKLNQVEYTFRVTT